MWEKLAYKSLDSEYKKITFLLPKEQNFYNINNRSKGPYSGRTIELMSKEYKLFLV